MDLAASAIFTAGLLTFASPCVLPLVPIYLGILSGGEGASPSRWRPFFSTILFSLGFSLVFAAIGLSATVLGRFLAEHRLFFQQVGGLVILLLGLRFLGWLQLPFGGGGRAMGEVRTRSHSVNALLLGIFFAFAWSPCIGSVLGAVLTYTSLRTTDPAEGMLLLSLYGLGFATPLLLVALFAGPALAWLRRVRRFLPVFEKVTGGLLVLTGFLLVTDRLGLLDYALARPADDGGAVGSTALLRPPAGPQVAQGSSPPASPTAGATCAGEAGDGGTPAGAACGGEGSAVGAPQAALGALLSDEALSADAPPRPTVTEFYSPACPICRQMIPAVSALRNECAGKAVRFRFVDTSTPAGRAEARASGVTGIPVFLFADAAGREGARLVGYQRRDALRQAVAVLIGERCAGYRALP